MIDISEPNLPSSLALSLHQQQLSFEVNPEFTTAVNNQPEFSSASPARKASTFAGQSDAPNLANGSAIAIAYEANSAGSKSNISNGGPLMNSHHHVTASSTWATSASATDATAEVADSQHAHKANGWANYDGDEHPLWEGGTSQSASSDAQEHDWQAHDSIVRPTTNHPRQRRLTLPDIIRPDDSGVKPVISDKHGRKATAATVGSKTAHTYLIVDGVRKAVFVDPATTTSAATTAVAAAAAAAAAGKHGESEGEGEPTTSTEDASEEWPNDKPLTRYRIEPLQKARTLQTSLPDISRSAVDDSSQPNRLTRQEAQVLCEQRREELRMLREREELRKKWQIVISFAMIEVMFYRFIVAPNKFWYITYYNI